LTLRDIWLDVGWLIVLIVTIAVPLTLDAYGWLTYFTSLLFWLTPILYLWPAFHSITAHGRGRRRRALRVSIATLVVFGTALDFLVGHFTFRFADCGPAGPYIKCIQGPGGSVPIEELLFYTFAPVAMVLVYACADERWLSRYNPADNLVNLRLIRVSPAWLVVAAAVAVSWLVIWRVNGTFPTYFAFLSGIGLVPTIFLYRAARSLINWPAFAVTVLYVLVTSIVWEVTLAIPRGWWGFEPAAMVGIYVDAWSTAGSVFPIEEIGVWMAAPFLTLLTYESAKAFFHHPRSSREALFGPGPAVATKTAIRDVSASGQGAALD
jgi:hypothetical protein